MHRILMKRRIALLLTLCIIFGNIQYAAAASQTNPEVIFQESTKEEANDNINASEDSSTLTTSAVTGSSISMEEESPLGSEIMETEELIYGEEKTLEANKDYHFTFKPDKSAVYAIYQDSQTITKISDQNDQMIYNNGGTGSTDSNMWYFYYYLEEGQSYQISMTTYIEQTINIIRQYQVMFIDFDEYNAFTNAGGIISTAIKDGRTTIQLQGDKQIYDSNWKTISLIENEDSYEWNINLYDSYSFFENESTQWGFDSYRNNYEVSDTYEGLVGLYDVDSKLIDESQEISSDIIVLAKYESQIEGTEILSYDTLVDIPANVTKLFEFTPDQTAKYQFISKSEYTNIWVVADQNNQNLSYANYLNQDDSQLIGYNLQAGVTYNIYMMSESDQTLRVKRGYALTVFDYDEYQMLIKDNGYIAESGSEYGYEYYKAYAPLTIDTSRYSRIKFLASDEYYYGDIDSYKRIVFEGESINKALESYKNIITSPDEYVELENFYDLDDKILDKDAICETNTLVLANFNNQVEEIESNHIAVNDVENIEKDKWHSYTFQATDNSFYLLRFSDITNHSGVKSVIEDSEGNRVYSKYTLGINTDSTHYYQLEEGKTYRIYVKADKDTTLFLLKQSKITFIDYDEFQDFKKAGGTFKIEYSSYGEWNSTLQWKLTGADDLDDSNFNTLKKWTDGAETYWEIKPYYTTDVASDTNLTSAIRTFKSDHSIEKGYYELENLYDTNDVVIQANELVTKDNIILAKYETDITNVEVINYKQKIELESGKVRVLQFTPDESGMYYMTKIYETNAYYFISDNAYYYIESEKGVIYTESEIECNGSKYTGYYFEKGQTYTIYVKAHEDMNFQVTRAYQIRFLDFDDYNAFTASGGTIKITINNYTGEAEFMTNGPSSIDDSDFKYIKKDTYEDGSETYYSWYTDSYYYLYVLDGETFGNAISDFQSDYKYVDEYLLKGLYQTNKTAINPSAKVTDNLLILAKYEPEFVYVQAINISGNASIKIGDTNKLSATVDTKVKYQATNPSIKWSSSNPAVATVDQNGNVKGVAAGKAIITATAVDGSNVSSSYTVVVAENIILVGAIKINGSDNVYVGVSTQLTALVNGKDGKVPTNSAVTWSSSNNSVASVDAKGLVKGVSKGTAVITVKSNDGAVTATHNITVNNVEAKKLTLNATKITMKKGTKYKWLETTVTPWNTTDQTITWSSSNTKVATVNASGLITAKQKGTATITATITNGVKSNVKVTVTTSNIKVNKVSLDLKKKTVVAGEKINLKSTVAPVNATNTKLAWSSSNNKVAKVTSNGVVTTLGVGKAKITCTAKDGSGKKATFTITVKAPGKTAITSIKSDSAKTMRLTWKEVSEADGYEIYVSTSKKGTYKKAVTIKGSSTVSHTVTKLKSKQKYYVKVKTYVNASKAKIYSSDSSKKTIKIK